jgi:hypothetical protein
VLLTRTSGWTLPRTAVQDPSSSVFFTSQYKIVHHTTIMWRYINVVLDTTSQDSVAALNYKLQNFAERPSSSEFMAIHYEMRFLKILNFPLSFTVPPFNIVKLYIFSTLRALNRKYWSGMGIFIARMETLNKYVHNFNWEM